MITDMNIPGLPTIHKGFGEASASHLRYADFIVSHSGWESVAVAPRPLGRQAMGLASSLIQW
jgi:hypothetical protein